MQNPMNLEQFMKQQQLRWLLKDWVQCPEWLCSVIAARMMNENFSFQTYGSGREPHTTTMRSTMYVEYMSDQHLAQLACAYSTSGELPWTVQRCYLVNAGSGDQYYTQTNKDDLNVRESIMNAITGQCQVIHVGRAADGDDQPTTPTPFKTISLDEGTTTNPTIATVKKISNRSANYQTDAVANGPGAFMRIEIIPRS
ncbi:MAG: hypothetical protein LBJ69_03370 [Holosporales bacterium]|jgi:hypothetical protein|nr:hypothetical protein [Holosporales bacterium]